MSMVIICRVYYLDHYLYCLDLLVFLKNNLKLNLLRIGQTNGEKRIEDKK